jgi:hypothetical protein
MRGSELTQVPEGRDFRKQVTQAEGNAGPKDQGLFKNREVNRGGVV